MLKQSNPIQIYNKELYSYNIQTDIISFSNTFIFTKKYVKSTNLKVIREELYKALDNIFIFSYEMDNKFVSKDEESVLTIEDLIININNDDNNNNDDNINDMSESKTNQSNTLTNSQTSPSTNFQFRNNNNVSIDNSCYYMKKSM